MAEMMQGESRTQAGWLGHVAGQVAEKMATQTIALMQPSDAKGPGARMATACAAAGCLDHGRYLFNRRWACSHGCLEQLLRAAVLEEQTLAAAAALQARPRVRLGRILIGQGTINEAQLDRALRSQRATGAGRLGCWLRQQVELPETEFTAALSIQARCPVFRIGTFTPRHMVNYLPRPLLEKHGALPLRFTGLPRQFFLCFEDRLDYQLMSATERMHGIAVDAGLLSVSEFWRATRDLLSVPFPAAITVEAPSADCMIEAMARVLIDSRVREARLVVVHESFWLRLWVFQKAANPAGEPLPHDILCTLRVTRSELASSDETEDGELLARQMLRILG